MKLLSAVEDPENPEVFDFPTYEVEARKFFEELLVKAKALGRLTGFIAIATYKDERGRNGSHHVSFWDDTLPMLGAISALQTRIGMRCEAGYVQELASCGEELPPA